MIQQSWPKPSTLSSALLTVSLHIHISRSTLTQVVGGGAAVGARVPPGDHHSYHHLQYHHHHHHSPADHPDVQHGEVAQHSPVPVLAPRDLSLGVGVHLHHHLIIIVIIIIKLLTSHFSDTLSSSSTTGPSAELETVTLGGSRKYLDQTRLGNAMGPVYTIYTIRMDGMDRYTRIYIYK